MPIDYKEYCKDWKLRSRFIRYHRAKNRCEKCGAINHSFINKYTRELCTRDEDDSIQIILTVAHLDHDKDNNSFFNLMALCQKCHLNYDRNQHIENRKYGRNWKKNQLKLSL